MVFIDDPDGRCLYVGREWTTLTGQPVSEALGHGWRSRVHPDDRAIVIQVLAEAGAQVAEFSLRFRLLKPDVGCWWVGSAGVPSIGPPGRSFLGYFASLTVMAEGATEGLAAYGRVGRIVPPATIQAAASGDNLDLVADHLIVANALLEADGTGLARADMRKALFAVGRALAARRMRRPSLN